MKTLSAKNYLSTIRGKLHQDVNASSLGFARIVIGIVVFFNLVKFQEYIQGSLIKSEFLLRYDGFEWLPMMTESNVELVFNTLYISTILMTLGVFYRVSTIITFLGYTYIFLLDKGHYNNHFYLISILLFFLSITNANRWGIISLSGIKTKTVPYWQLMLFKVQIFIVYFYGGLAKIESDWLSGYPMRFWLYDKVGNVPEPFSSFFETEFAALFVSWFGLVFDLLIGFMLFSRKWRRIAWIPLILFHVSNHFLWTIGEFPWLMLLLTSIYFNPDWAAKAFGTLRQKPVTFMKHILSFFNPIKLWKWMNPFRKDEETEAIESITVEPTVKTKALHGFLVVWLSFQLLFPFRQFLFEGNPSWTGEGHLFAWRMMLMEDIGAFRMKVTIPEAQESFYIGFDQYMNYGQMFRLTRTPTAVLQFAHFINDQLKENADVQDAEIYLEMWKSVNEREPQLFNDTTLNYAKVEYSAFKHSDWINEWSPSDQKVEFSKERYRHWKDFSAKHDRREGEIMP